MSEREAKLLAVQQADFVLYDAALFLDTHPECTQALDFYRSAKVAYERAAAEYETQFGPLSRRNANGTECWNWLKCPMPWEKEA